MLFAITRPKGSTEREFYVGGSLWSEHRNDAALFSSDGTAKAVIRDLGLKEWTLQPHDTVALRNLEANAWWDGFGNATDIATGERIHETLVSKLEHNGRRSHAR